MGQLTWVSLVVLLLSALLAYRFMSSDRTPDSVEHVLRDLIAARSMSSPHLQSAAIGYNSNLDLIVHDAVLLFEKLNLLLPGDTLRDHEQIQSMSDLRQTLAFWFSKGSAAERLVSDLVLFKQIVTAAASFNETVTSFFIGGNAALMAQRLALNGTSVFLGGRIGSKLSSLLDSRIMLQQHPSEADWKDDEVHLILEYKKDTKWGSLTAPRANRIILVHDITNSRVLALEDFHQAAKKFKPSPQVYVVAGLHLLEGQTPNYRQQRLVDIVHNLQHIDASVPIHFELASVGNPSYLKELAHSILGEVDSMGLNEQELFALYNALDGKEFSAEHFSAPTVVAVTSAIEYIFSAAATKNRLARIHFHSLEYHIIATHDGRKTSWNQSKCLSAVAAGSLAATYQACDSQVNDDTVELHLRSTDSVQEWKQEKLSFFVAAVLVCKKPVKTVGLGDIISSTGLLYSW